MTSLPSPLPKPTSAMLRLAIPVQLPPKKSTTRINPAQRNMPRAAYNMLIAVLEAITGRRTTRQVIDAKASASLAKITRIAHEGKLKTTQVVSITAQMPSPTALEASVRLVAGNHSIPCAIRLDSIANRWVCTDIQIADHLVWP